MFSKRHYEEIALAMRQLRDESTVEPMQLNRVINKLADVFLADNYRFNRVKFIEACRSHPAMRETA